jgi:hypothetical protein
MCPGRCGVSGCLAYTDEYDERKLTDPENRFSVHLASPNAKNGKTTNGSVTGNS